MADKNGRIRIFQETERLSAEHPLLKEAILKSRESQFIEWQTDPLCLGEKRYDSPAELVLSAKRSYQYTRNHQMLLYMDFERFFQSYSLLSLTSPCYKTQDSLYTHSVRKNQAISKTLPNIQINHHKTQTPRSHSHHTIPAESLLEIARFASLGQVLRYASDENRYHVPE